jgi:hypothetical protein
MPRAIFEVGVLNSFSALAVASPRSRHDALGLMEAREASVIGPGENLQPETAPIVFG